MYGDGARVVEGVGAGVSRVRERVTCADCAGLHSASCGHPDENYPVHCCWFMQSTYEASYG